MFKNICLIGLPYAGKSSLGKKLAFNKKVGFIETDKMIEYTYQNSLKNIIKLRGINSFLYMGIDLPTDEIPCPNFFNLPDAVLRVALSLEASPSNVTLN